MFVEDETILANELGYSVDPNQELLIAPETLLSMPIPQGDCDDFSTLIATLLLAFNLPAWFVTVAIDNVQPWRFSHVYVRTYLSDTREEMVMDCSHGRFAGDEPAKKYQIFRKVEWLVR